MRLWLAVSALVVWSGAAEAKLSSRRPPPPSPPSPETLLQPGPGRVPLSLENTGGRAVAIEAPSGGGDAQQRHLCDLPCTLYVPPGPFAFVGRAGDTAFDGELVVPARGAYLRLRVPTRARFYGGLMLLLGGIPAASGGVGLLIAGADLKARDRETGYAAGGALLGVGLAATFTGVYLLVNDHRSPIVEQQDF